jgi:hypothetical protein
MNYFIDDQGIHYYGITSEAELAPIDSKTSLDTLERIAAELEALDIIPPLGDERRETIRAAIFGRVAPIEPRPACECDAAGLKPCGMCDQ